MKSIRELIRETVVLQDTRPGTKRFLRKHPIEVKDHPVGKESQFSGGTKKSKTNPASYEDDEDKIVYEEVSDISDLNLDSGKLKLKDGSTVKLSDKDIDVLNALFFTLRGENKKRMLADIIKSKESFNDALEFARTYGD